MYRCQICGNTDKFLGFAEEKGNAVIFQSQISDEHPCRYSWIYYETDRSWNGHFRLSRCYFCNSDRISEK
ncbi:MAG: RNA-binding protein [Actinobacteria bacterium]|nr:RNA-binding protein [Actinomycetota bacterium]